jgi:hypothetical protein
MLGRLHDWLEPQARAKADQGPTRQAVWLGRGLLAVTGFDAHAGVDPRGGQAEWQTPAGLKLIDTRAWSVRTLEPRAARVAIVSDRLLAFGALWDSREQKLSGSGLTAFGLDGSRRYHLYGDEPVSGVQGLGPRSRVLVGGAVGSSLFDRSALLDLRTGRAIGRVRLDFELLAGDQPFWY